MKLDRQSRKERLPTVPETASLLAKAGNEAASPPAFAAHTQPRPRRLLAYAAACVVLGLIVLYVAGALPFGSSSGAWIRSLPKKRHHPAAVVPDPPQPTGARLDAAASRLEGGRPQTKQQPKSGGGADSGMAGSSDVMQDSSAGDARLDSSVDAAAGSEQPAADAEKAKAQPAKAETAAKAPIEASDAGAVAGKEVLANKAKRPKPAAEPLVKEADNIQSAASSAAAQPKPAKKAPGVKTSGTRFQDSSSGGDPKGGNGEGSSEASSQNSKADKASDKAGGLSARDDNRGKEDAAPESSSDVTLDSSRAEAAVGAADASSNSKQSPAVGSRGTDESRDFGAGSLNRASSRDEAALLADEEAKEAQPDSMADSSSLSAASSNVAQQPDAADGGDPADAGIGVTPGGQPQGDADGEAGQPAAKQKPRSGSTASRSGSGAPGSSGSGSANGSRPGKVVSSSKGSKGSSGGEGNKGSNAKGSSSVKGGSGRKGSSSGGGKGSSSSSSSSTDSADSTAGADRTWKAGSGSSSIGSGSQGKKSAGRKAAAGQRSSSGAERVALATRAGDQGQGASSKQGCLAFAPASCHLIPGEKEPLRYPVCDHPPGHIIPGGPHCSFDLAAELAPCPIIGGGLYFEREEPQPACEVPPFWRERGPESPSCASDGVCCSGDGLNGTWQDTKADQAYGKLEFRLDESMGCHYHQYTRRQVLHCLANTTVVLWGDSMVRQMFNRIPALFRGHRRAFDAQTWRAERFDVCEAADARTHAPAIEGLAPRDGHYRLWGLADLTDEAHPFLSLEDVPETQLLDMADPDAKPKAFPKQTCGRTQPVSFHYVPATALWEQYRFGGFYLKTHTDISQSIWVSQVGYWDLQKGYADEHWLMTMQDALDRGLQKLVLITVPTAFVGIDERDPKRWILRDRNNFMRRWAANDTTGRTVILDMDALSMAPNAPDGLLGNWTDWHYSCKFSWVDEHEGRNLTADEWAPHSRTWLDPSGWTLGGLQPNVRRDCIDDMNLTVMQMLFNLLCNKQT